MIDPDFWNQPLWTYFGVLGFALYGAWVVSVVFFNEEREHTTVNRRK